MNKGTKIIILSGIGVSLLLIIAVSMLPVWGNDEPEQADTNAPKMKQDESFTLEDMTKFVKDDYSTEYIEYSTNNTDSKADELLERLEKKNADTIQNVYSEEESQTIKDLQAEIDLDEKNLNQTITYVPQNQVIPREKKPELSYEERLKIAKEARYGNQDKQEKPEPRIIKTRVAIFRDQFRVPGELVEMVLTENFSYNGQSFKKGTLVFADLNINKSRVLFHISNIAHVPMNIEVRDIRDGRVGMYSTRAGELWKKYETEGINNSTQAATDGITNNRILSTSIDALAGFFQNKRVKQNEKILMLNDQELIVYIKEN